MTQFVRGGHRSAKVAKHVGVYKDTWYIFIEDEKSAQEDLGVDFSGADVVTAAVPERGMVIFNNMTPHRW